jgi:acetyltransferase-like isoleucine patch superfamily enzyme
MLPPVRWWRSLCALFGRARVHPQALLLGQAAQIELGCGCKIGARVRIDPGLQGLVAIKEKVWIAADVEMETHSQLQIGTGTSVQRRCTINGSTTLGRGCILAPGVFISSGTHPFREIAHLPIREQEHRLASDASAQAALDRPVWVQDDCWLGTNAVICPGVTIGKGSVVGANAVVTRNVPPYTVVAGSPARVIGKRLDWHPPSRLNPAHEEDHPYFLDARLHRDHRGICIEVLVGDPLLVALAAPSDSGRLVLAWRTSEAVTVCISERSVKLPHGEGSLELQASDLHIAKGIAHCALALSSDTKASARLYILSLQIVED